MADLDKMQKKIALLHRYPKDRIAETNAAFPFLQSKDIDVLTFKNFDRLGRFGKFWKSLLWIFYAPLLVFGKGYDVIYCDDSYPFYPFFVKLVSPKSKVILRIGDLHLMYYYSGRVYDFLHFFEKIVWQKADGIIAISQAMADFITSETLRHVEVVLDPVDPKYFHVNNQAHYGEVMFHGTLTKNKNVDILLECARRMPSVDFTVIGDGPDLKRLRSLAPSNVFFTGWVPFKDIASHISSCAVGVALRSNNPGNEYVVTSPFLQYGAVGRPCLVTRRKVFVDYEWQFSGVEEMVEKLTKLLKASKVEGNKLRKFIIENHDAQKIGDQIWEILKQAS